MAAPIDSTTVQESLATDTFAPYHSNVVDEAVIEAASTSDAGAAETDATPMINDRATTPSNVVDKATMDRFVRDRANVKNQIVEEHKRIYYAQHGVGANLGNTPEERARTVYELRHKDEQSHRTFNYINNLIRQAGGPVVPDEPRGPYTSVGEGRKPAPPGVTPIKA